MLGTQKSKSSARLKVGDLVKFRAHYDKPLGLVVRLETLEKEPHPSQPERDVAFVVWCNPYTPIGNYQTCLLEVYDESR